MRHFLLVFSSVLVLALAACSLPAHAKATQQNGDLIKSLVDALNSKNRDTILGFVKAHCSEQLQARGDRLVAVSDHAPFKLVSSTDDGKGNANAELQDADGVPVSLKITFDSSGKIAMMSLRAGGSAPSKDYSGWKDLASLEENICADSNAPAMSVAVWHDGQTETAASGLREVGKTALVKSDDPFSIGSIGKPLCSTIIGRLVEMGKLRWDETLAEALPNVPMKDAYKSVTIDEVLHHRGGIPEYLNMRKPDVDRIVGDATDPVKMRDNFAHEILGKDPTGKPNERFSYSNGGYLLLGHIAETLMGKPYEALVKEMIFEPLQMTHSYTGADRLPEDRPSGHVQGDDQKWHPTNFTGRLEILFAPAGGGMWCSAADLVKFGKMHMDGLNGKDGLLKASTIQRLHSGIPEDLEVASPSEIKPNYVPTPDARLYACGWGIEADPGIEIMHTHNGSNGTMRAQLAIFPKSNLVIAAFVNCGGESEPSPPLQACIAVAQRYAKQ